MPRDAETGKLVIGLQAGRSKSVFVQFIKRTPPLCLSFELSAANDGVVVYLALFILSISPFLRSNETN